VIADRIRTPENGFHGIRGQPATGSGGTADVLAADKQEWLPGKARPRRPLSTDVTTIEAIVSLKARPHEASAGLSDCAGLQCH
jgi:hypothetical protein